MKKHKIRNFLKKHEGKIIAVASGAFVISAFLASCKLLSGIEPAVGDHDLSINDIDDEDLVELYIDDPDFRAEYGITDEMYEQYKMAHDAV